MLKTVQLTLALKSVAKLALVVITHVEQFVIQALNVLRHLASSWSLYVARAAENLVMFAVASPLTTSHWIATKPV